MNKPVERRGEKTIEMARVFTAVIMWFGTAFVIGTIGGIWIKVFWMGWVFAP